MFLLRVWIVFFQLYVHGIAEYIIIEEPDPLLPFSQAFTACSKYNGNLVSVNQFNQHVDDIRQQCSKSTGEYWIGDYSTLTPVLSMQGCYKYSITGRDNQTFTIKNNSIAKCHARCPFKAGIAVQENNCQCVEGNYISKLKELTTSDCDILKNGEILGGKMDAMSVYGRQGSPLPDGINPFCVFRDCANDVTVEQCTSNNLARTVCLDRSNNVTPFNNTSDWWTAMATCISGSHGYLMSVEYQIDNKGEVCGGDIERKIWTNARQYKSSIVVPDIGITDLQAPNIVCRTANLQSGLISETGDCNAKSSHGYICITDQEIINSTPLMTETRCIVNVSSIFTGSPVQNSTVVDGNNICLSTSSPSASPTSPSRESALHKGFAEYIILEEPESPLRFSNAFTACNNYNGTLVSMNQLNQHVDDIRQQCSKSTGNYWIGDYSTITPFLTLMGCYKYSSTGPTRLNFTIINNTIARCHARCPNEIGVAIKGDNCQCVTSKENLTVLNASECNIIENGEILGGLENQMSIYIKDEELSLTGDDNIPMCFLGDCDQKRGASKARCSAIETASIVCLNETNHVKSLNNTSNWWTAMETCLSGNHGYLMNFQFFMKNRDTICNNSGGKIWTTVRQYRSSIVVPDVGIENLQDTNIVCRTSNLQSGLSNETGDCNSASRLHGYICITEQEITKASPAAAEKICIVDISSIYTTSITLSSTDGNGNIVSRTSSELTFPLGAVAGGAGGGVVLIIAVIVIVIIIKRKNSPNKDSDIAMKDQDFAVYADSKEGEYDVLHKQKQRLSQLNGGNDTYAHTHIAKENENTYDTTNRVLASKRGENDYDYTRNVLNSNLKKMDENAYDSTNVIETNKSVNGDENAYDSTAALVHDAENTYDKCDKPCMKKESTYDHAGNVNIINDFDVYDECKKDGQSRDSTYDHTKKPVKMDDSDLYDKCKNKSEPMYDHTNDVRKQDKTDIYDQCEKK